MERVNYVLHRCGLGLWLSLVPVYCCNVDLLLDCWSRNLLNEDVARSPLFFSSGINDLIKKLKFNSKIRKLFYFRIFLLPCPLPDDHPAPLLKSYEASDSSKITEKSQPQAINPLPYNMKILTTWSPFNLIQVITYPFNLIPSHHVPLFPDLWPLATTPPRWIHTHLHLNSLIDKIQCGIIKTSKQMVQLKDNDLWCCGCPLLSGHPWRRALCSMEMKKHIQ